MSDPALSSPGEQRPAAWRLVGRRDELDQIAGARAAGEAGVVLLAPAGVGKSRLAREALTAAEDDGALVAWVQATRSAAAVPLGAFAGLIPDDVRSDEPLELMRRSAEALRERAEGRQVVLGVDDAQLLDPTSAALVLQLATTGTACVIATVRSGEPAPDAITSLVKDAGARRLDLGELTEAETASLAEAIAGGPLELAARRWAYDTSRGNALYVRELVGGALDRGALEHVGELWHLTRRPPVGSSLAELITGRLIDLPQSERAVLELLALGEPLRAAELGALTQPDALVAVEARRLVTAESPAAGGEVRLAHPLYGEVLAADLGTLRSRDVRRRLAATLQARDELTAGDALRVARLLLDAAEPIPPGLLIDAARAANLAGDPDLGAQLAQLAVDDGAGLEAVLVLARAHAVHKRFEDAEAVLAAVEDDRGTQDNAMAYLEQRAVSVLYWGLQRPDEAQALLARAQSWWPEQAWQRRLDPMRLHLGSLIDGFEGAIAVSADILADPELDPVVRRQLEPVQTVNLFYTGRTDEAYALGERIRPSVPLGDHSDALALVDWSIIGLETGRDFPGLDAWMSQTLQEAVRANDHEAAGIAAITVGGIRFFEGRYADARRWLAEAELHLEQQDTFGTLIAARATQVGVAHFSGDVAGAGAALERCRALPAWSDPLPSLLPYIVRAEAWAACAESEHARAQRMLLDAAGEIADMPGYAAQLTYEAMRAGAPAASIAGDQASLAERNDSRMVAAYAAHATALARDDGAAVLEAAQEMADIGAWRYGMEAAAGAASAFLRAGRQDSARRAATLARELHDRGQEGTPPQIDGLDAAAVALTAREEQLIGLARRGLTNAEIADRLVLSVRTVESHVYRAMQKLGVSDRRDL